MKKSTVTVQQWIDNLPTPTPTQCVPSRCSTTTQREAQMAGSPKRPMLRLIGKDMSTQSDDCSQSSSVEHVLEFRKADPEAVLMELGFGPPNSGKNSCRIPARFLQPSKLLTHIDMNKFLEEQGEVQADVNSSASSPSKRNLAN